MTIKFIVPISNFSIESAFKLGDIFYTPSISKTDGFEFSHNNTMTESEFNGIIKCMEILEYNMHFQWKNSAFAITSFEDITYSNIEESVNLVNRVCEKVDRSMDYLRLKECQVGNFNTLPGIPGIMRDGFKNVFKVDLDLESFELVNGKVTLFSQEGIGLMPSEEPRASELLSIEYECIFGERDDEVFLNCRSALTRVNEAMYMSNLNAAFIYLMTTLEMLADNKEQLNFKKVRAHIQPFICRSKKNYHELAAYLKELSHIKRTEVVHNGKSIYDLYENSEEVIKELFKITGIIVRYVKAVISTDIQTFERLECKRSELLTELGV